MQITDIPNEWRELLEAFQANAPEAILAGGAIRDWYLGQEPKDIDIFIAQQSDVPSDIGLEEIEDSHIESAENDDSVCRSISYSGRSLPINVIWCSTAVLPQERFERFDFGLCKIMFDGKQIIAHQEFLWDIKHSLFTLRRASNIPQTIESFKRYERLRAKYPFPLMIPHDLHMPFTSGLI